ncbi:MAG: Stp1/IreP family PP2C-type Ser/Thr phosphatase [Gammaproteobacteria bacterium]|nr:Stp1/IreP family PP2C-type Ser/Thr phosphatase [Gammaproteobacteria bacterium]
MNLQGKTQIVGQTDTGRIRQNNEDSIGYDSALGLLVLADGMGGHLGGEVASSLSVDNIIKFSQQHLPSIKTGQIDSKSGFTLESLCVQEAIEYANDLVYRKSTEDVELRGMGTTLVVILFYDNRFSLAHIGDSRCYRYRNKSLSQITKDHSLLQELIDRGFYTPEEASKSLNKNLVTKALGIDSTISPDVQEDLALKNDIYLLCSDGLTDLVEDEYISLTIKRFSDNLEEAAKQLITKANQNGGKDNISVILCKIKEDFSESQGWFKKLIEWF